MISTPAKPATRAAAGALTVGVSAWICAGAYPDSSHCELAWIALVPFLVCLRGAGRAQALVYGAVWMLVFAWGINDWFPGAAARYLAQPLPVGFVFFLGVTFGTAAPATMGFALLYRRWGRSASVVAPLAAAAAWVAFEFLRANVLGDPWGLLGYSQAARPQWIQIADITGVYGVSFLVLLVNASIAELLVAAASGKLTMSLAGALAAIAIVVPGLAFGYGATKLAAIPAPGADGLDLTVVQGNLDLDDQWLDARHEANLQKYLDLTGRALAVGESDLVVWPENAITFFLEDEPDRRAEIASLLATHRATLLTGAPHRQPGAAPVFFNSAFLIASDGNVVGRYDKRRLLPFGEYQPVARLGFLSDRFDHIREFSPGDGDTDSLDSRGARLGVVICNEAMFPEPSSERVEGGAGVLLALTNDSWVGARKFAQQAMDKAVLRAVEQRRWLVRASTSGPSAIVDSAGRVIARTRFAEEATLSGRVGVLHGATVYSRIGDAFAWACALALLVLRPGRDVGVEAAA